MSHRRRTSLLATAAVLGALAVVPATGDAASGLPPACFESPQFAICSSDVGPLANRAIDDPAGTAGLLVGVAENVVCYGNDICSLISTG